MLDRTAPHASRVAAVGAASHAQRGSFYNYNGFLLTRGGGEQQLYHQLWTTATQRAAGRQAPTPHEPHARRRTAWRETSGSACSTRSCSFTQTGDTNNPTTTTRISFLLLMKVNSHLGMYRVVHVRSAAIVERKGGGGVVEFVHVSQCVYQCYKNPTEPSCPSAFAHWDSSKFRLSQCTRSSFET